MSVMKIVAAASIESSSARRSLELARRSGAGRRRYEQADRTPAHEKSARRSARARYAGPARTTDQLVDERDVMSGSPCQIVTFEKSPSGRDRRDGRAA
jgi:hypothetical protein